MYCLMYLNHSGQTRAVHHHARLSAWLIYTHLIQPTQHMDELQLTRSDNYEMLQHGYCVPLTDWGLVKWFNERRDQPPCKRPGRYQVYSDSTRRKTIRLLCVKADDLTFVRVHQKRYFYSSRNNEIRPQAPSRLPTGS